MKLRRSLSVKIILLALLNVALLVGVVAAFARVAFRIDLGSVLLAPTRDRILSISRLIALELPNRPQESWDQALQQYSATYPARFYLFESSGRQLAGKPIQPPPAIRDFITSDRNGPPWEDRGRRSHGRHSDPPSPYSGPPPNFAGLRAQGVYWIGTHIPIWTEPGKPPMHCTLVWQFPALLSNMFFFDYRPWLAFLVGIVLVSLLCWVPFIRGLSRSISQITGATEQIAGGHFEVQLSTARRDELGQLTTAINRMAERLSSYVHGQKRFLSDVAHELCSPIARMQMAVGILEQRSDDESQAYLDDLKEEVEHMSKLINELLSFSKAEILSPGGELTTVNVSETVQNVLEREGSEAVVVETKLARSLAVVAKPEYLFRSLANLVRNAIRYAGHDGPIEISATPVGQEVSIVVSDHGPGVPEPELENLFKPFYRPEFARQRETGGTGLGLAIVKSCIEACGGAVSCRNRLPHGLQVEIRLPAAK